MVSRGRTGAPKRMTHFRYTFKKILVVHRNEWNQMWLSSGKGQRGKLGKWLRKTICAHTKTLHQHGLCTLLTTVCPFVWIQPPSPMYASRDLACLKNWTPHSFMLLLYTPCTSLCTAALQSVYAEHRGAELWPAYKPWLHSWPDVKERPWANYLTFLCPSFL